MSGDSLVAQQLRARGLSASVAARAARLWAVYAPFLEAAAADAADPVDRARSAWDALVRGRAWTAVYAQRARSALVRALEVTRPELSRTLLCSGASDAGRTTRRVITRSSHETEFLLHECLPRRVRGLSSRSVAFRLMAHLAERLVECARSASRRTLQKRLAFVDRVLFDPPALVRPDAPSVDAALADLRTVTAAGWLQRLAVVYPEGGGRRVGPKLFRGHLSVLSTLHARIVRGVDAEHPIPLSGGVSVVVGADSDTGTSFATSDDEPDAHPAWRLQRAVGALQARLCRRSAADDGAVPTAFAPEEVERILAAAQRTDERLMVMLLLTTGVRIGGLCRIRCRARGDWAHLVPADALSTVEKGSGDRAVQVNAAVRVLVARWFRECRPAAGPAGFLFPSPADAGRPLSTSSAWRVVRTVLRRADVTGRHAHPHTFRHTFVHMLLALGLSADVIARFVGHRSAATTAGTYSRLTRDELGALAASCPVLGDADAPQDLRERWRRVMARIVRPYEFSVRECAGLPLPSDAS